ncbi:hypothetical protein [Ferrigenium sp. UT5]|uniref:hypothetical protein n=1 Tax=Ferrigenium sp. UT5 TaxID=3242105 RepID=UPI0038B2484B
MKYLISLLLLVSFQGCMLIGEHGMHGMMNHGKAEETKATPPSGESTKPVSEPAPHQS